MKYPLILPTISSSLLASSLLITLSAHAGDTTELKVTGTIRPSACQASFPPDGMVNFGTIKADMQLKQDYKKMPVQEVSLRIACDGPTKIAVRASDNRQHSHDAGIKDVDEDSNFGLGKYRGKNIGGYSVMFRAAIADGKATDILMRGERQGANRWNDDLTRNFRHNGGQFSFGSNKTPVAFSNLTAQLAVSVKLSKEAYLQMADDIQLDGSLSLEMIYL